MTILFAALALSSIGDFDVREIPLPDRPFETLVCPVDGDARKDVIVHWGYVLTVYSAAAPRPLVAYLAEGTSAFDVANIDDDAFAEIVAVRGNDIVQFPLTSSDSGSPSNPTLLFTAENDFAGLVGSPFARPLVVTRESQPAFVLPHGDVLELRSVSGRLLETVPARAGEPSMPSAQGLETWSYSSDPAGHGGKLWWQVTLRTGFEFILPEDVHRESFSARLHKPERASQAFHWQGSTPFAWPSMPVHLQDPVVHAHFSLAGTDAQETLIAIRADRGGNPDSQAVLPGPAHPFEGVLVVFADQPPDFDGDGYGDLLLWRTPEPAASIDSVVRTLTRGTWPVRFLAHRFIPAENRFEARSFTRFECRLPLARLFDYDAGWPVRNTLARDINGDGRTDLAMSPEPSGFAIWLTRPGGFPRTPDYENDFGEDVELLFEEDLDGEGHWAIGLKGRNALHLVSWSPPK